MRRLVSRAAPLIQPWRSLDLKPTLILISSAILLTVYRYYFRPPFFRGLLRGHLESIAFRPLIPFFAWYLLASVPLFLIPALLIRGILREPLRNYGVQAGNVRWGLGFVLVAYVLMLPVLGVASRWPSFQVKYPLFARYIELDTFDPATRWLLLIAYELAYGCYFISWEFFFRGFLLYGLEPHFGTYTVFIQTIPFTILHFGKPFSETMGAVFTGILLGLVGLHTRSFWYAFLVHWGVAVSMDLLAL